MGRFRFKKEHMVFPCNWYDWILFCNSFPSSSSSLPLPKYSQRDKFAMAINELRWSWRMNLSEGNVADPGLNVSTHRINQLPPLDSLCIDGWTSRYTISVDASGWIKKYQAFSWASQPFIAPHWSIYVFVSICRNDIWARSYYWLAHPKRHG